MFIERPVLFWESILSFSEQTDILNKTYSKKTITVYLMQILEYLDNSRNMDLKGLDFFFFFFS